MTNRSQCAFRVRGLDCDHEVEVLRAAVKGLPGIESLGFDLMNGLMTVDYVEGEVEPSRLARTISRRSGLETILVGGDADAESDANSETAGSWWSRRGLLSSTIASGVMLGLGLLTGWFGPRLGMSSEGAELGRAVLCGLAVVAGGIWLFPRTVRGIWNLQLGIDVLMGLAIVGAAALGQWDEAATVAFLFGVSESLEAMSIHRARRAVRRLLEITPETAERIGPDGAVETVAANQIQTGDHVLVRSGDRVPIDGAIIKGTSSLDEKTITGESVPVARGPGEPVFAGTVNGEGTLEVEASAPLGDALITRIVERVRAARAGRAPVERRISQFARYYTPAVVFVAVLVMTLPLLRAWLSGGAGAVTWPLFQEWFMRGLVVLVIACPCALVIATPVAVVSGLAAAARRGVLIKGGEFLEQIGRLRALAFDKTGTLTLGRPDVVEVVRASGSNGDDDGGRRVLQIAAALGDRGGHVLGKAIARHARDLRIDVPMADDYQAIPGKGALGRVDQVEYHMGSHRYIDEAGLCRPEFHDELDKAAADVGTSVALTTAAGPLGWIRLADKSRPEAAEVLAELHKLGLRTVMLTGDNSRTAAAVARELGVGDQRAELLPDDKVSAVDEYTRTHGPTGMVGDGVNDAPALAAARVSIALGGVSSGAALETADIVLMADDLRPLPWLIRHSRATLRMIHQNIALAIGTKALVLILALFGLATLWMAIAADVGTTLVVVANALRLLRAGDNA